MPKTRYNDSGPVPVPVPTDPSGRLTCDQMINSEPYKRVRKAFGGKRVIDIKDSADGFTPDTNSEDPFDTDHSF